MLKFGKSRRLQVGTPCLEGVENAIAARLPPFLIISARIRAEQNAAWFQRGAQIGEDAR